MKKLLIVLILLSSQKLFGQKVGIEIENTNEKFDFIDNNRLKYSFGLFSCDTCVPISNIGYRVILSLSLKQEASVKQIDFKLWIKLLNNPKKDWAANIILYWIFDRDCYLIQRIHNKNKWRKYLKNDEIEYWSAKFEEK